MLMTVLGAIAGTAALVVLLFRLRQRLALSLAKHRSLAGHPRTARRIAALVPFYDYDDRQFFRADGAPDDVAAQRRDGLQRLAGFWRQRFARTLALTAEAAAGISDIQFTAAYRVPFQFSRLVRQHLPAGSFLAASSRVTVTDLDGNVFYDLTGSYGVNLLGHDFYKDCIARGAERVRDLGPVLGSYHPTVAYNVSRLREISGLDEVSFHMSGTEAVMQAVRLARYHTRRPRLVRFCGAYHGWWGDVQPGIGNPMPADGTFTLAEMSERTLHVLRTRRDIACVLVNPLQALHPNAAAPADGSLVDSGRRASFDRAAYTTWLQQLRAVCDARGIVMIFDEIFVGFRLALEGARTYFGVQPDLITYGKTLGGGLPVGVLCGRGALMKRSRDDRPGDVCFARGTFNSHPYVMAAMCEFLHRLETPEIQALYSGLDRLWDDRAAQLNKRLQAAALPVRVANLSSIWTVCYTAPSRYNWMLQYYLRAEGLALSWVGSGRLVFSLNFTDDDFAAVADRFVRACGAMRDEGWWWADKSLTNRSIRRQILREMWRHRSFVNRSRPMPAQVGSEISDLAPREAAVPAPPSQKRSRQQVTTNEEWYQGHVGPLYSNAMTASVGPNRHKTIAKLSC
jgi:glutamate-1-semialdehyde 2,1-aminomutase